MCGFAKLEDFQRAHAQWVRQALDEALILRDDQWSEAIAVGSLKFTETVKNDFGFNVTYREVTQKDGSYALREPIEAYGLKFASESEALTSQSSFFWNETVDQAKT